MAYTLTLKTEPEVPLEADAVAPDRLASLDRTAVERLELFHGNQRVALGEFFGVTGDGGAELHVEGDLRMVKLIGFGMREGSLTIHGTAGMHVGAAMAGGRIVVEGDVVSASKDTVPVPPLRVELRDEHGQVVYRWTAEAPRDRLEPEESARFRAELPGAPAKGRAVLVRFAAVDSGDSAVSLRAPMNPQANPKDR